MSKVKNIIIAAKCAPQKSILNDVKKAGLEAVELYFSRELLNDSHKIIELCKSFSFGYAVHAPNDGHAPLKLPEVVKAIGAKIVVFHNVYWEDEWERIIKIFKNVKTKLCIENVYSIHEPLKFMRRYGMSRCLDLEHLQMECAGVYEEEFIPFIRQSSHIHLTGYVFGSNLWHTHIHYSPEHSIYLLNLLKKAGYSGFVVSEAKSSLQTYKEFKKLNDFCKRWRAESVDF